MRTILIIAIVLMVILIGCNIEENSNSKDLDYLVSLFLLPFLVLAIYAVFHLNEFKNFIHGDRD